MFLLEFNVCATKKAFFSTFFSSEENLNILVKNGKLTLSYNILYLSTFSVPKTVY